MNSAHHSDRPMDIFQFTREKLRARDIEPRATAVWRLDLGQSTVRRFVFAQSLFDHAGLSAMIAERPSKAFWEACAAAFKSGKRGGSRVRFRGEKAWAAMAEIQRRYPRIEAFFDELSGDFHSAAKVVKSLPQYGSWSAYMMLDQAERLCKRPIDFSRVRVADMTGLAVHGAQLAADHLKTTPDALLEKLLKTKWPSLATPMEDRPLNQQEFETLFCDYSHAPWQPAGSSARTVRKELVGFGKLAERIRNEIPEVLK